MTMTTSTTTTADSHADLLAGPAKPQTVEDLIKRDRWGRPLIARPGASVDDGPNNLVAYTRASTLGGALEDIGGITTWKMRLVARGLSQRADLVMRAASVGDPESKDGKKTLGDVAEAAFEHGGGSARATIGTAVHAFVERYNRGEEIGTVPTPFDRDVASYVEAITAHGMRPVAAEQFVVNDACEAAGTFDAVYELGGQLYIGDLKTGSTLDFGVGKFAVQLAVYAGGSLYDPTTGARAPLEFGGRPVNQQWALLVHTPAGTGITRVYRVDLHSGRIGIERAMWVREWRKRKDLCVQMVPGETPGVSDVEAWTASINYATQQEELTQLWQESGARWPDEVKQLASARMADLQREAQHLEAVRTVADHLGGVAVLCDGADGSSHEPGDEPADAVLLAIAAAPSRVALGELWQRDGGTWTEQHKAAADDRYRALPAA